MSAIYFRSVIPCVFSVLSEHKLLSLILIVIFVAFITQIVRNSLYYSI